MEYVASQAISGLILGSIYALMAVGLALIFSILNVINFAHGEFYMVGGYLFYYLFTLIKLPPTLALFLSIFTVFLLGALFEFSFIRPMLFPGRVQRPAEYALLITFGLAIFLQNLALGIFGPFPKRPPDLVKGYTTFGPATINNQRLMVGGIAIGLIMTLVIVIYKTWIGKALRAVSQDKEAAAASGINPFRMNTIAFGIGTALAAAAGALIAPIYAVVPDAGVAPAIRSFVIIVLGGMGSIGGAIVGGLIIGEVSSLSVALIADMTRASAYKDVWGLLIFALILLLKPTGLFGHQKQ